MGKARIINQLKTWVFIFLVDHMESSFLYELVTKIPKMTSNGRDLTKWKRGLNLVSLMFTLLSNFFPQLIMGHPVRFDFLFKNCGWIR